MVNQPTNRNQLSTARVAELRWAERSIAAGQVVFTAAHSIAALWYRVHVHRARRARAVLVASAADVIGRAL
jgi:hypothetical protein